MQAMTAEQARDAVKGLTFEDFWAGLQETRKLMEETFREIRERQEETALQKKETALQMKETDKEIRERQEKIDRQMERTARQMEQTDKKISRLGNRIGDLIEHFAAANVIEKFRDLGYEFTRSSRNMIIEDKNRRSLAEVDIFLENGDFVMAVEVKTNLGSADVAEHLHRMDVLRADADSRGDRRKYLGAIAAAIAGKGVREQALASGFYVLEQQGDNVRISTPENRRIWQGKPATD